MLIYFVFGFLLGVVQVYHFRELPDKGWFYLAVMAALGLLVLVYRNAIQSSRASLHRYENYTRNPPLAQSPFLDLQQKILNLSAGLLFGLSYALFQAQFYTGAESEFFNQKGWVSGQVTSLPQVEQHPAYNKIAFEFSPEQVGFTFPIQKTQRHDDFSKIKLSWYLPHRQYDPKHFSLPKLGEKWRFYGKLKSLHASSNPVPRDYEVWLFQQHIDARMTVSGLKIVNGLSNAERLTDEVALTPHVVRQSISDYLDSLFENSDYRAIYRALIIADKSDISAEEWRLFQQTGTIHLMAISGLHMSIMAAIGFYLAKGLWFVVVYRQRKIIFPVFAASVSLLMATAYLFVSGGAIPTQRAWIMVVTAIAFLMIQRRFQPLSAIAMAVLLILLWDSRTVLHAGFWLSFSAVLIIVWGLSLAKEASKLGKFIYIQFLLGIVLLPVLAWHYHEVPIYSIAANLIAVPFITLIGLPLLFLAVVLGTVLPSLAGDLIGLLDTLWGYLWLYLHGLVSFPIKAWEIPQTSLLWLFWVYLGLAALQLFWFKVNRYRSFWFFLLLIFFYLVVSLWVAHQYRVDPIAQGNAQITVLDVGQGQSVVVRTESKVVVFDVGAKWGLSTDAAKVALLPYLKSLGILHIDDLIISHSDSDHAGATRSVLENISLGQMLSGQAEKLNLSLGLKGELAHFQQCREGQVWHYDGVEFEMVSPSESMLNSGREISDNDWSCVLKVTASGQTAWLMGDLGSNYERQLIERYPLNDLKGELLIAGHHGSHYSTSTEWLNVLTPEHIVFTSGYMNRFGFPDQRVLKRVDDHAMKAPYSVYWWNTACSGALSFEMTEHGVELRNESRKQQGKWYHHRCSETQQGRFYQ